MVDISVRVAPDNQRRDPAMVLMEYAILALMAGFSVVDGIISTARPGRKGVKHGVASTRPVDCIRWLGNSS